MDAFSRKTSDELFAHFPEWRNFAREEKAKDGTSFLVVSVPPPPEAKVDRDLLIDTSGQQIALTFDFYETHFYTLSESGPFACSSLLNFLQQVMSEQTAVISWWLDNDWCGASQLKPGASFPQSIEPFVTRFNRKRVRSWKGTFNADTEA